VLAGFAAALLASPPACAQGVPVLLERGVPVLLERALVEFGFIARGARLATPMVTRSASDLYGIRMTSEISNLGKVSEFSSYRTLSERLGRTSILDSSDTLAPSINKFDPRLFKILQNPDLFEKCRCESCNACDASLLHGNRVGLIGCSQRCRQGNGISLSRYCSTSVS
jgi:hypothetical protein